MSGLLDGLKNIWSMLVMFKDFLVNMIKSSIELVKLLLTTTTNVKTLIMTLPPWLIAVATCTLSVSVLYILVGRENGK